MDAGSPPRRKTKGEVDGPNAGFKLTRFLCRPWLEVLGFYREHHSMSEERPSIFLSINDLRYERGLKKHLKRALDKRGIELYVLMDDPHLGEDWTKVAQARIDSSDGVVVVWTERSPGSNVETELRYVLSKQPQIHAALVVEQFVDPPKIWPEKWLWTRLKGYSPFVRFGKYRWIGLGISEPDWTTLIDQLTIFAWRHAARKAIESRTPRLDTYATVETKWKVQ